MKPIKTVLNTYLFKTGLEKGVRQQQALTLWPTAVGKKIADNTAVQDVKPVSYTHLTLPTKRIV